SLNFVGTSTASSSSGFNAVADANITIGPGAVLKSTAAGSAVNLQALNGSISQSAGGIAIMAPAIVMSAQGNIGKPASGNLPAVPIGTSNINFSTLPVALSAGATNILVSHMGTITLGALSSSTLGRAATLVSVSATGGINGSPTPILAQALSLSAG